ncbi:MAG: hypothetical protein AAF573_00390 [Bacteroidota bacterium]
MNEETNIIEIAGSKYKQRGTINPQQQTSPEAFNTYQEGMKWGITAGVSMAVFLVLAQIMTMGGSIVLKFFKYMVMFGVLAYGLSIQKSSMQAAYRFKNGIRLGAVVSAISALTLALANVIIYAISEPLAFDKFSMQSDSVGHMAVISGVLLFEVFVFGMIITFIILQKIKPKRANIRG